MDPWQREIQDNTSTCQGSRWVNVWGISPPTPYRWKSVSKKHMKIKPAGGWTNPPEKNMLVKLEIFPKDQGENWTNIWNWNHHLDNYSTPAFLGTFKTTTSQHPSHHCPAQVTVGRKVTHPKAKSESSGYRNLPRCQSSCHYYTQKTTPPNKLS